MKSGRVVTAAHILIATGASPSRDLGGGAGAEHCITSNEAFNLEKFPRRIFIAGGGYIAIEFAHIFHGLGAEVTLCYRGPKILRGFEEDMRDALTGSMKKHGIRVLLDRVIAKVDARGGEKFVFTGKHEVLEVDEVMLAIGREPNTKELGLEKAGVVLGQRGRVEVDEYSRTNVGHIFENNPTPADHHLVPTAVFSQPEIGTVGLTEAQALAGGHAIDVYKSSFKPLKHTLSGRDERALFKLIVDAKTDRVLGCHIFGPDAAEIIQIVAVAMKMGATKAQFDATIALHPSAAEELVTMRTKSYSKAP
jgi:glutathione reductase (NADPH)